MPADIYRPMLSISGRLKGNGVLENVIGNPLETTIALSHLIFEGTLDARALLMTEFGRDDDLNSIGCRNS
jgi:hypothetical protein